MRQAEQWYSRSVSDQSIILDHLRLNLIPGIGPRMHHALLDYFGSPASVLSAGQDSLQQVSGVGRKLAQSILDHRDSERANRELERCEKLGVRLITRECHDYPPLLNEIHNAPPVFYCRGELLERDQLSIAIVGSRRCTLYGRQQAQKLASGLARAGMTIVSGLARGIDGAAHEGAIQAKGRTVAVMGTGVLKIYPPEHDELAKQVISHGALVSEFPLDQRPSPGLFPQRNRIIAGLSHGVIIVEATQKSGALHTARHAMEQGREVFALPGRADSLASEGCHALIRDGVTLIRNVDDVLESLGPLIKPVAKSETEQVHSPRELTLNERELEILNLVTIDPLSIDEILRSTDLAASSVLSTLTVLEMKRMVRRLPGSMMVRTSG
jgi:DNA processing protein